MNEINKWMNQYVRSGKLSGAQLLIAQKGEVKHSAYTGTADREAGRQWQEDTIVRIYSMTKPITTVALMQLYERRLVDLDDPVEKFIPSLKDMQVLRPDAKKITDTRPAAVKPTLRHLLTHTAGFTYGFNPGILAAAYMECGINFAHLQNSLAEEIDKLSKLPLQFTPGTRWNYGVSTDVAGRVVEVVSGQALDQYFADNILAPLSMKDTSFCLPAEKLSRFASLYGPDSQGGLEVMERADESIFLDQNMKGYSGGGGLLSTTQDYFHFAEMLRKKGECRGHRLLQEETVDLMMQNHLPGDLAAVGEPVFAEVPFAGVGFGFGGWSMIDPDTAGVKGSKGDFGWGGRASTVFWIDPTLDLTVIFMTQLKPSNIYPLRSEFREIVHKYFSN
ncbi:MAG: serine hydrolase [Sneathiella sp.]|uniref:serine hydrolase domain-containing protein n=1 Tax=Sneathiella sp. TaxID=1964365 RepID=UPI000C61FB34|nr:serine hydrolase domain-containing protein [Sneathiella sp.]MAZ02570.1 serine hydrolase [Sneathiella sp.]